MQRLRHIKQLGLTELVFPSATHTRFQHAIGTYYLGLLTIETFREKGIHISTEEEQALTVALLCHDIGHGPYSHALEGILLPFSHEELTIWCINQLLNELEPDLLPAVISMLTGKYSRKFFNQLISSQLDLDRLDYLARDSFFAGVSEGRVGYERIIKLMCVGENEQLAVEVKGFHSIERFLMARYAMYRQVYLHKTAVSAEAMLKKLVRVFMQKVIDMNEVSLLENMPGEIRLFFNRLKSRDNRLNDALIEAFLQLTDEHIWVMIKELTRSTDKLISILAKGLYYRKLHKVVLISNSTIPDTLVDQLAQRVATDLDVERNIAKELVLVEEVKAAAYMYGEEPILFVLPSGKLVDYAQLRKSELMCLNNLQESSYFYVCIPYGVEPEEELLRQLKEQSVWI